MLPCLQEPDTGPYPEPCEFSPSPNIWFLYDLVLRDLFSLCHIFSHRAPVRQSNSGLYFLVVLVSILFLPVVCFRLPSITQSNLCLLCRNYSVSHYNLYNNDCFLSGLCKQKNLHTLQDSALWLCELKKYEVGRGSQIVRNNWQYFTPTNVVMYFLQNIYLVICGYV